MKNNNELKILMNSLLGKEVDTAILLRVFSKYYNESIEALTSVLNFKIIQCTNARGTVYKGVVSFEDKSLTVDLDCTYNGYLPKYTVKNML